MKSTEQDLTVINNSLKNKVSATKLGNIQPVKFCGNSYAGCECAIRTGWYGDLRVFRWMYGSRKHLFKKITLSWLRNRIQREAIEIIYYIGTGFAISEDEEKECIRRPKNSCRWH